ncbi:MAG: hypothetical protein IJ806_12155 [Ruminococcus sp.]|nr:hypothetical protein [Ruminococcus sp.]
MTDRNLKRSILGLLSVSYYGLFTLLCVILEPGAGACLLLMVAFAFIWVGIEFYFCIGTQFKKAVFTGGEFLSYGNLVPLMTYLAASAADYLSLRKWFIRTAAATATTILYRSAVHLKDNLNNIDNDD